MNQSLHKLLMTVLLVCSISIIAQKKDVKLSDRFDVKVGNDYKETDGKIKTFFKYKEFVIAINTYKKNLVIQKFDPQSLNELKRIEIKDFVKDKKGNKEFIQMNDKIIFFYEAWDKENQIESLKGVDILLSDLTVSKPYTVLTQEGKIAYHGHSLMGPKPMVMFQVFGAKYLFKKSFDGKKLLVTYRLKPLKKRDTKSTDKIAVYVYNEEMELEWKQILTMPYTERKMENGDFTIDNEGNFYMLATVFEDETTDERKKNEENANYHLELFKVLKETDSIIKNEIVIGNRFVEHAELYEDATGNIIVAGTSKNPDSEKGVLFGKRRGESNGVFIIKLNKEGGIKVFNNYDFPLEMLNKYSTRREKNKRKRKVKRYEEKPVFNFLTLNDVIINDDGSILILGEQQYMVRGNDRFSAYYKGFLVLNKISFIYRDILVAKIDKNGELAWMNKLAKRQRGNRRKRSMSYMHMYGENKHHLLFLDNVKNLNLPDDKLPYEHLDGYGGYLTTYNINDITGEVSKEAIFNTRDVNGKEIEHFETNKVIPLSKSEILIEGFEGRSKDFLVKVSVKK